MGIAAIWNDRLLRPRLQWAGAGVAFGLAFLTCWLGWNREAMDHDADWMNFFRGTANPLLFLAIALAWAARSRRWPLWAPVTYLAIGFLLFAVGNREYGPFKGPVVLLHWPSFVCTYFGHYVGLHDYWEPN